MKNNLIEKFILNSIKWLNKYQGDDNIILSSRIRLSRNLKNVNYPINCSNNEKKQVFNTVESAVKKAEKNKIFESVNIGELSDLDINFLLERKFITNKLASDREHSYLMIDQHESIQIMVNEEDHLKIQMLQPGNSLRDIWKEINDFDNKLSRILPYSFDKTLGYKTSSPLEVGTGMKASVMLNLPGLYLSKQIDAVIKGINKLGLTVNGFHGENSSYIGNLYQITNQSTLGELEEQIIERIENIANQIVIHEKNARLNLLEKKKEYLLNCIGRAYGILRYSYILTAKEALDYLSILRMGVDLKIFTSIDFNILNDLLINIQNAHLQKFTGFNFNYAELDTLRADVVRNKLQM